MIQDRTLELLKNPKNIQIEDLQILEKDITKYPYMQSIRALYLYGIHLYNQNVYNELLTLTAAYTTDKKNLYQFIKQSAESEQKTAISHQPSANSIQEKAESRKLVAESELPPAISFDNNSEDLLPKVKFEPTKSENVSLIPNPQSSIANSGKPTAESRPLKADRINKHEEEMKRLIAEVEAKMARNRAAKKKEIPQEEIISGDINFSEYEREEPIIQSQENTETKESENLETSEKEWKPLDFMPNTPDALLEKENISVSEEKQPQEETIQKNEVVESPKSNVPQFINTWQSWLRLDKTESVLIENPQEIEDLQKQEEPQPEPIEEITENSKEDTKSKAIDTFIESNPKISKVNKDFTEYFTPKDKGDDISHLMTETLANLYVEQRLYTKAIQSFKILIQKHPERKEHFKARIQEVKELRVGKNND